ncbi:MAG TPA: PilN domain-containing protein [Candidatus Magasanikbacteria bacterium]|nr:PilN domain-containing protein [Candidatus Magasanikbacteria bacterium]
MMILNLNLLPLNKKKELKILTRINLVKNFFVHSFQILFVFLCFLLIFYYNLNQQLTNLNKSRTLINSNFAEYNKEINELNKNIGTINVAGERFQELTPKFLEMLQIVPENIKITSLSLSLDKKAIFIPGVAKNRDALLSYGEALKKIPWIKNIDIPKTQLLQKENISFNIGVELK